MLIALSFEFQPGFKYPVAETKQNDFLLESIARSYFVKGVRLLFRSLSSDKIRGGFEDSALS